MLLMDAVTQMNIKLRSYIYQPYLFDLTSACCLADPNSEKGERYNSRLNRYNFETVRAIDFIFSTLYNYAIFI